MSGPLRGAVERAWRSLDAPGLVVAVSGGPDSVALAHALAAARGGATAPLVLAHFNHLLRGADSDADEAFVAELAASLPGAAFTSTRDEVAARGGNVEAAARRARYRWLAEVARARGLRAVATGHTADDQAETVLHRLLRGAGVEGLRGIAARRELAPGVEVVRPLLGVTRAEVLAYLRQAGQPARHDSSNDDLRYTRNRIRHQLLPLLARDYNPRAAEALARLAAQAAELADDEARAAGGWLARAELPRAGDMVILDIAVLRQAPRRLVRAALRRVWRRERWAMDGMGHAEWERLADLAAADAGAWDLPGGAHARRRAGVLQLRGRVGPREAGHPAPEG